jgi:hypothetical protein
MRGGAIDYLTKPVDCAACRRSSTKSSRALALRSEVADLQASCGRWGVSATWSARRTPCSASTT